MTLKPRLFAGLLFALSWHEPAQAQNQSFPLPPANWRTPVMDQQLIPYLLLDRFEYRLQNGGNARAWDAQAWFGGDYNKLWLKSEGENIIGRRTEDADLQALYARLIAPFWNVQAGVRDQIRPGPAKAYGVLALQGLAPYRFNVEGSLFFRTDEVSGRLEAEYDQLLTQRLILQPRIETNFTSSSDRKRRIGSGINDLELGLRLRYEIRREIAPYIGLSWTRKLGSTAGIARSEGESVNERAIVAGLRIWY